MPSKFLLRSLVLSVLAASLQAQSPASLTQPTPTASAAAPTLKPMGNVLFIGNSFLFGFGSAVRFYRAHSVNDLNNEGIGGVPALFKAFCAQAGLDFAVNLETSPGKGFDYHLLEKAPIIAQPWDRVVMLSYSTLNREKPGDPALLIRTTRQLAELLHAKNSKVNIRLIATWSRADQVYPPSGHWHNKPIEQMALDIRSAYNQAAAGSPYIQGVIPVGEAWNRAFKTGVADPNPYDGIAFGQLDLWTYDHYHPSTYGYYLEALMIFGDLTGLDPRALGKDERSGFELGLSGAQAMALQQIAYDELTLTPGRVPLARFTPLALKKD